MSNFNEISKKYEKDSLVQKSASEVLFDILDIQPNDDVLDLGCGTGHLSKIIRQKTAGKIIGVDPSKGMVNSAKEKFSSFNIDFQHASAEDLDFSNEFNAIFCNSAFQWFRDAEKSLANCHRALKSSGKIAIQAPARDDYCPNFLQGIEKVKTEPPTKNIYASFSSPWLFLNTDTEYAGLFKKAGFEVEKSVIEKISSSYSVEEAYKIFESGASAGYLNQEYYSLSLTQNYIDHFRIFMKTAFAEQADSTGKVNLTFYRIYLLAKKP